MVPVGGGSGAAGACVVAGAVRPGLEVIGVHFVLVSEDELRQGALHMIELTRNLVELSGAAALAAALKLRDGMAGRRVAIVCSGGNISPASWPNCSRDPVPLRR